MVETGAGPMPAYTETLPRVAASVRSARDEVSARLAMMPHLRVRLSHDVPASVAALEKVAGTV